MKLTCEVWSKPSHLLFQIANVFIVFANIEFNHKYSLLYMRCCLLLSALAFGLWGWLVLCSWDTFTWNIIFFIIQIYHIFNILYAMVPHFNRLSSSAQTIYQKLGFDGKVSTKTFNDIIYKNIFETLILEKGDIYCVESMTEANKLSLLYCGKVAVLRDNCLIKEVNDLTFIDAIHWFINTKKGVTPVCKMTLMAVEKTQIISWQKNQLERALVANPVLNTIVIKRLAEDAIKTFYL